MKRVRLVINNSPKEEYNLLFVVMSSTNGMVGICERLYDGFGMDKPLNEMDEKERNLAEYKGKLIEVPLKNLITIYEK